MSVRETYHIELLGPARQGERASGERASEETVQQRISVRTDSLEGARERALGLFARARVPQRSGLPAEAVRVIDGAGTELFRWSRFDERTG